MNLIKEGGIATLIVHMHIIMFMQKLCHIFI